MPAGRGGVGGVRGGVAGVPHPLRHSCPRDPSLGGRANECSFPFLRNFFLFFYICLAKLFAKKKKSLNFQNNARVYGKCSRNICKKPEETITFAKFSRAKCFFFFNFLKN
jgi:hypothetical protein